MKVLLGLAVMIALGFALVWAAGLVLDFFSEGSRELRSSKKVNKAALANKTRQLHLARTALIKIAANDSGNPSLDANIALEDIQSIELTELEN